MKDFLLHKYNGEKYVFMVSVGCR